MTIKEHPEWTQKYPAIDGIAKEAQYRKDELLKKDILCKEPEKAIRSDIEEILKMNNVPFEKWYSERKQVTESLLKQYELVASIPSLIYPSEKQKLGLDSSVWIDSPIKVLREGLDYLEKIKEVREEYRK